MTRPGADPGRDPRDVVGVLLAGGRGRRLHELTEREAKAALPMAGRRRLADFALQEFSRAGLARVVAALGGRPETLARHLPEAWGDRLDLAPHHGAEAGQAETLRALIPLIGDPAVVVVAEAGWAGAFDLPMLLEAHRYSGVAVTVLMVPRPGSTSLIPGGVLVLDWPWARARLAATGVSDLKAALVDRAHAEGCLGLSPQSQAIWRDAATPDAFRRAWLELAAGVPFPLPPETGAPDEGPLGPPDLVMEAGGLTLTVPRFGARRSGRWTLLEDSVVMPGARVAPGARLARALVAPGAIVPAGLVLGEDEGEDARWFRVGPGPEGEPPTILVTAAMLSRRAAERMRLHSGAAMPLPLIATDPA